MNGQLIYPEFPDTFWSFKHALAFVGKRAAFPPLGLLTVAAMLPPEWIPRLVDTNVRNLADDDLAWADYRIGLVGRGRLHYWKLLLWTQFRCPRLLPDAISLAIYGYHFRKVCEKHVV